MFCPSARVPNGINLVVFRDRLRKTDSMRILGEEELHKYLELQVQYCMQYLFDEVCKEICQETPLQEV